MSINFQCKLKQHCHDKSFSTNNMRPVNTEKAIDMQPDNIYMMIGHSNDADYLLADLRCFLIISYQMPFEIAFSSACPLSVDWLHFSLQSLSGTIAELFSPLAQNEQHQVQLNIIDVTYRQLSMYRKEKD